MCDSGQVDGGDSCKGVERDMVSSVKGEFVNTKHNGKRELRHDKARRGECESERDRLDGSCMLLWEHMCAQVCACQLPETVTRCHAIRRGTFYVRSMQHERERESAAIWSIFATQFGHFFFFLLFPCCYTCRHALICCTPCCHRVFLDATYSCRRQSRCKPWFLFPLSHMFW